MMKVKKSRKWLWLFALILMGGIGFYLYKINLNQNLREDITFVQVKLGNIEEMVTSQGTLEPKEYVDVGAQVSGQLEVLHVQIGDQVRAGDLIAEINAEIFESQVSADEARLKVMQAQKIQTEAEIRQAKQKLDRHKELIKGRAISQEAYEDTQTALDIIKAKLMSLNAQIEEAQSTLEGNKANLNYTKIYAPVDGTVVSLSAKEGQTLNANQTTPIIVQIADLNTMTVKALVTEADVNKIEVGMPVYFKTLGAQNRKWEGFVRQILPTPEVLNSVVLYHVLVDVENEDQKLMSGMTTQMFFILAKAENVPVIPTVALLRRAPEEQSEKGDAYFVKVKSGQNITEKVVVIGISDRTNAQLLSGLEEGDQVVLPAIGTENQSSGSSRRRTARL